MTIRIAVSARDSGLRRVLAERLDSWPGFAVVAPEEEASADVLLALGHELPPSVCANWVARGGAVVVLATVFRESEYRAFLKAGAAAYLAMDLDLPNLSRVIEEVGAQALYARDR